MPSPRNINYLQKTLQLFKEGKAFYFTDFSGSTVQKLESLRRELKQNKGNYLVVKNTLGLIALREMGFDENLLRSVLSGPTGIAIAYDDPIVLVKALKANEGIRIKGGIIEGVFYDAQGVSRFSEIPSKAVLYRQVIGSLNILGNLTNSLKSILANLIYTLNALKDKQDKRD
ncbi:MAG: 50S ribosomal protein L10 [candidate division WOR-3 bacterium]